MAKPMLPPEKKLEFMQYRLELAALKSQRETINLNRTWRNRIIGMSALLAVAVITPFIQPSKPVQANIPPVLPMQTVLPIAAPVQPVKRVKPKRKPPIVAKKHHVVPKTHVVSEVKPFVAPIDRLPDGWTRCSETEHSINFCSNKDHGFMSFPKPLAKS